MPSREKLHAAFKHTSKPDNVSYPAIIPALIFFIPIEPRLRKSMLLGPCKIIYQPKIYPLHIANEDNIICLSMVIFYFMTLNQRHNILAILK